MKGRSAIAGSGTGRRFAGWFGPGLGATLVVLGATIGATSGAAAARATPAASPLIAILCYHDLSDAPGLPMQTVSADFLRAQIRACRNSGWTFMSLRELLNAREHPERLPARVMVLTFDDAYRSFRDQALPVLRAERVPATVAVISSFVDRPPADLPPLMTWDDLRALAADTLVEIASHSHDLHRYETSDPYRDTAPSPATRRYLLGEARYENREEYRARIIADLSTAQRALLDQLGRTAPVLVWPYGATNEMALGVARNSGFAATLVLGDREVTLDDLRAGCLPRVLVTRSARFAGGDLTWLRRRAPPIRAAQVDLDALYDPDPARFVARAESLVKRVREIGATHVFLQACSDAEGDGHLRSAWFMNHQVAVRADIWSMIAFRLKQARIEVWARVPTMNLTWSWQQHPEWRIARAVPAEGRPAGGAETDSASERSRAAWPTRLSPDLPESRRAAMDLLTDLAVYTPLDGVLFDDDAFMAPGERLTVTRSTDPAVRADTIEELLAQCREAIRAWRPECAFGRDVPAVVVDVPNTHPGLSQDFDRIVREDGLAVVMAYPWTTQHGADAAHWVEGLGRRALERSRAAVRHRGAESRPSTVAPILFKLQTYDWRRQRWIPARDLAEMLSALRRAGVPHFGLSPVNAQGGDFPPRLFQSPESTALIIRGSRGR